MFLLQMHIQPDWPLAWATLFVVMLAAEATTLGLTTLWFAGGALAALVCSAAGTRPLVQVIVFLAVSVLLLALVRPVAKKYFNNSRVKTNADALAGMEGTVTEEIRMPDGTGRVSVRGQDWAARQEGGDHGLAEGTQVRVIRVSGATLVVEPAPEKKKEESGGDHS